MEGFVVVHSAGLLCCDSVVNVCVSLSVRKTNFNMFLFLLPRQLSFQNITDVSLENQNYISLCLPHVFWHVFVYIIIAICDEFSGFPFIYIQHNNLCGVMYHIVNLYFLQNFQFYNTFYVTLNLKYCLKYLVFTFQCRSLHCVYISNPA